MARGPALATFPPANPSGPGAILRLGIEREGTHASIRSQPSAITWSNASASSFVIQPKEESKADCRSAFARWRICRTKSATHCSAVAGSVSKSAMMASRAVMGQCCSGNRRMQAASTSLTLDPWAMRATSRAPSKSGGGCQALIWVQSAALTSPAMNTLPASAVPGTQRRGFSLPRRRLIPRKGGPESRKFGKTNGIREPPGLPSCRLVLTEVAWILVKVHEVETAGSIQSSVAAHRQRGQFSPA